MKGIIIHKYLCGFLDSGNLKDCDCDCDKSDYKMSEEEVKATIIRQMLHNLTTPKGGKK